MSSWKQFQYRLVNFMIEMPLISMASWTLSHHLISSGGGKLDSAPRMVYCIGSILLLLLLLLVEAGRLWRIHRVD
jgi:hypothetical protein